MQQFLPWILASLSLALLLGAGVLAALSRRPQKKAPLPTEWTLTSRPVFSSEERRVYRQLREALPHHIILSKLPLLRFTQPTEPEEVRYWYDLLGAIHVGFAVCSTNGRVLAAIDLSTERGGSRRALQIKQSVLAACKVRYLRCSVDQLPSIPELQLLVPQTGPVGRGPQAAGVSQARDQLATTLASRRRERTTLWTDSGYLQDSFFGADGRTEGAIVSGFGSLRSGVSVREMSVSPGMTAEEALARSSESLSAALQRH
jgi:Protein of unknown function (DUF2726)